MGIFREYSQYDALGLAELIAKGEVSAADALESAIDAAERLNPQLNAIVHRFDDKARGNTANLPDGPFKGVPFLLKDLLDAYAGEPFTMGSRFFKDYVPDYDAELVRRFKQAGLNIFGKTNTPEFGLVPMTDPELFGSARNPWNTNKTAGGSSGGTGSAVSAGIVPIASGGDGGGSIRIPASCNGIVGLKPTRGRTPSGPVMGDVWYGFAIEFALSRTVRDTAALLDAVAGADAGPPSVAPPPERPYLEETQREPGQLRIAYTTDPLLGRSLDPECKKGVEQTARKLAALGHHVEEVTPPIDREAFIYAMATLICGDTAALIRGGEGLTGRKPRRRDFEAGTWAYKRLGAAFTAEELTSAFIYAQGVGRLFGQFMQNYDVFLTSTLGMPPTDTGHLKPKGMDAFSLALVNTLPIGKIGKQKKFMIDMAAPTFDFIPYTPLANATGQPSISLPLHWSDDGLPVGMMFTGRFGDEATLIRLAAQLEQEIPWKDRKPPVYA